VRNWGEKCKERRLWNEIFKQVKTHQELQCRLKKKKERKKEEAEKKKKKKKGRSENC
jgi:hypothetical protein